ncbi:hypothetical protein V2G26_003555 [Clonostachys chloroleuca]
MAADFRSRRVQRSALPMLPRGRLEAFLANDVPQTVLGSMLPGGKSSHSSLYGTPAGRMFWGPVASPFVAQFARKSLWWPTRSCSAVSVNHLSPVDLHIQLSRHGGIIGHVTVGVIWRQQPISPF